MQVLRKVGITAALLSSLVAWAADAGSFAGRWAGTMTGRNGGKVEVELVLKGEAGTWRMSNSSRKGGSNPCLGRDLPVAVVSRTDVELQFDVNGAQVIKGCIDHRVTLTTNDGKTLKGSVSDGRALEFARR